MPKITRYKKGLKIACEASAGDLSASSCKNACGKNAGTMPMRECKGCDDAASDLSVPLNGRDFYQKIFDSEFITEEVAKLSDYKLKMLIQWMEANPCDKVRRITIVIRVRERAAKRFVQIISMEGEQV